MSDDVQLPATAAEPITIYIDEFGFTGDDLYNPKQPHFVIASTLIGDAEANEIMRRCFPRYQGKEFKFSTIWRREAHRNGLRAFAGEMPALADRVFLWIVDKRFSLLAKMYDYLIEPSFYAAGYDFYADGHAMRYLNTAHRDILRCGTVEIYDQSVRLWDQFARRPSAESLATLHTYLGEVAEQSEHPISTIFGMLHEGTRRFEATYHALEDFTDSSEIQVTSILSNITYWRHHRTEDFELVHDEFTNFARWQDLWDTMVRDNFTADPLPLSNGTTVEMPLRVRSTTGVCSENSPAIQLCDLLAGFGAKVATAFDTEERDPFLIELVRLGAGALVSGGVRPHDDYATGPVPRRNGPDPVDRMTEVLKPYFERIEAAREPRDN